jgi:hypothetical protein
LVSGVNGSREVQPVLVVKVFSWSHGLGCEISPVKTRSARKKDEFSLKEPVKFSSTEHDHGALRGIKTLARAKS